MAIPQFTELALIKMFTEWYYIKVLTFTFNILMSSFLQVLKATKELLPSDPVVHCCVVDYDLAIWSAVRSVLADVEVMRCVFHWTQALWRKVITSYRLCNVYMHMTIKVHVAQKIFFG